MFSTEFLDIPALVEAMGTVRLPGSKSISNRVLLLAALSEGSTIVRDLLASDDTQVMLDALAALRNGDIPAVSAVFTAGVPRFVGRSRNTPEGIRKVRVAQCRLPMDFSGEAH